MMRISVFNCANSLYSCGFHEKKELERKLKYDLSFQNYLELGVKTDTFIYYDE